MVMSISAQAWRPSIGDPTVGGWLVAFGYVVAAICSFGAMRAHRANLDRSPQRRDQRTLMLVWLAVAVAMLLLGAVRQLDLGSWIAEVGRGFARRAGWYGNRRHYQKLFIVGVAAAGMVGIAATGLVLRHVWRRTLPIVVVMFGIVVLTIVRATSLHAVDQVLGAWGGWVKRGLELLATSAVIVLALLAQRRAVADGAAATHV